MFRDQSVDSIAFLKKFKELKEKFDAKEEMRLDSEYHQQLKVYINNLYRFCNSDEVMTNKQFDDIREPQMSNLNRLQKLKNRTSYKKDKHKNQSKNEDWG